MDLSIQDWGAIGELLGAVAVFATLAYLAIQVRQSNELSERNQKIAIGQAYQFRAAMTSDNARASLNNHDVLSIEAKGYRGEEFTDLEKRVRRVQAALGHFAYDNMYYQYSLGLVDEESWLGTRSLLKEQLRNEIFVKSIALPKPMYTRLIDELLQEIDTEQDSPDPASSHPGTAFWRGD